MHALLTLFFKDKRIFVHQAMQIVMLVLLLEDFALEAKIPSIVDVRQKAFLTFLDLVNE
jgi:hypothetical protein